ncbi:phage regulatory CII family protein [Pseudomonas aeruginosa]|uniref:phage regulatory CII family protein n=1 Tax=Pseudomonas aeruginosa TaxID=287 RepID=UPI0018481685
MPRVSYADQMDRLDREVLPLPDALNLVARNPRLCRGGITGFAYATGRNPTTTAHKFDPAHTAHVLNLHDITDFLRHVTPEGRAIILDALHADLGDSAWFFVSPELLGTVPADLVAGASEVLRTAADAMTTTAQNIADGRIDAAELAQTGKIVSRIVRSAVGLYQRARAVHEATAGEGVGNE